MDATRDKRTMAAGARGASGPPGPPGPTGDAAPCVWVGAGLLAFRLCDRGMDCERCPLDAALRGRTLPTVSAQPRPGLSFPEDRSYLPGHLWVQRQPDGTTRLGVDALLATLLALPERVSLPRPGEVLVCGAVCVAIDTEEGVLEVASPFDGPVIAGNAALLVDPTAVVEDPYGRGWLLSARPDAWPDPVFAAATAAHEARLDAQRFRRRVAMDLLLGTDEVGVTMQDGGEPLLDLRDLVGARRHLELLRELIG